MSIASMHSQYLTIAEVATILRVSKMTVYRLVRAQALACVRFGNSYRIPQNAVEEFIAKSAPLPEPETGNRENGHRGT